MMACSVKMEMEESGQFHLLARMGAYLDVAGEQHDANARTHGVGGQAVTKVNKWQRPRMLACMKNGRRPSPGQIAQTTNTTKFI